MNEVLNRSVEELELWVRSYNCLKNANIQTIGDLVQKTEAEMLRTKNFGRKSLNEIKEILGNLGLGFGMKIDAQGRLVDAASRLAACRRSASMEGVGDVERMRHRVAGFKLKRDTDQRVGLLRNLVTSVIEQERIVTTAPKAKAAKPLVDKMITLAKRDTLHTRRQAAAFLRTPDAVQEAVRQAGHPVRPAQRRLHPHRQAGLAQGRRRRAGDARTRRFGTGEARCRSCQAPRRAPQRDARRQRRRRGRRRERVIVSASRCTTRGAVGSLLRLNSCTQVRKP